jgi:hypothetical protein
LPPCLKISLENHAGKCCWKIFQPAYWLSDSAMLK